jgi:hypothetical protein
MKKKHAIILLIVNAFYLASVFYVNGTLYPSNDYCRFLIASLFFIINLLVWLGIDFGVYD